MRLQLTDAGGEGVNYLPREQSPCLSVRPEMRYDVYLDEIFGVCNAGDDGRGDESDHQSL